MCDIRPLEASEIEVRAQQITEKGGAVLLLYKNARCDMSILDEKFTMYGWKREHSFKDGKNYCKVSIWDDKKSEWVSKEDVGTESNTEAEKGEASDAFKRACTNIGIGRELYTSPFIYLQLEETEIIRGNGKPKLSPRVRFEVSAITYDDKRSISGLRIMDQRGKTRFEWPKKGAKPQQSDPVHPIAETQPAPPQPPTSRKRITSADLNDKDKCNKLLQWMYGFYTTSGYARDFDPGYRLLKACDVDADTLLKFSELFESYKQAITGKK